MAENNEATRDWYRRAIVRFKEDVTCRSFAGQHTYTKGQEIEMLQWGRSGRPVDNAWWSDFDIDLAFIVDDSRVEVIEVLEETQPHG